MENGKRIHLYLNNQIIEKIDNRAQDIGITRSAFLAVVINQYFQGQDALNTLSRACDVVQSGGVINGE